MGNEHVYAPPNPPNHQLGGKVRCVFGVRFVCQVGCFWTREESNSDLLARWVQKALGSGTSATYPNKAKCVNFCLVPEGWGAFFFEDNLLFCVF